MEKREFIKRLFTVKDCAVNTNRGKVYYDALYKKYKKRLDKLEATKPVKNIDLQEELKTGGFSRRTFLKWVSATTAMLMLPPTFEPLVAKAAELMNRLPVIWVEFQDCAGNTEAFIRSDGPKIEEILLDIISLEYHETLMAPAGYQAEAQLNNAVKHFKGKYILIVEGSVPTAENGIYGTIGASGETFIDSLTGLSKNAAAIIAVGNCATFGGVPAASPNPTGAKGVMDIIKGKSIINIPACPANPINIVGTILLVVLKGQIPELDSLLRPKWAFGYRIHDNCERRAHFDAGEYVEEWGDDRAKNNWCLYKMGCKGPMTFNNCPIVRYNEAVNWPVGAGHGCIGCSEPEFWDKYAFERPIADANIKAPDGGVESSVDQFGLGILGVAGAGIVAHAAVSAIIGKKSKPNEEEKERDKDE